MLNEAPAAAVLTTDERNPARSLWNFVVPSLPWIASCGLSSCTADASLQRLCCALSAIHTTTHSLNAQQSVLDPPLLEINAQVIPNQPELNKPANATHSLLPAQPGSSRLSWSVPATRGRRNGKLSRRTNSHQWHC